MKRLITIITAILMSVSVGTIYADSGIVIYDDWMEDEGVLFEDFFGGVDEPPCDFVVYVDYSFYETMKMYFDENGDPVELRWIDKKGYFAYYTDSSTVILEEKNSVLLAKLDLATLRMEVRGNGQHLTLPKMGNVFRVAGHWIIDLLTEEFVVMNGNHEIWPDGDWTPFCNAFGVD